MWDSGYEESPRPKTAYLVLLNVLAERLLRSSCLQKFFMLSGISPWPVVDTANITMGSAGNLL